MSSVPNITLLVLLCIFPQGECIVNLTEKDDTYFFQSCPDFFIPEDITLGDDAFHGTPYYPETWYAEAFLNNSYSMVFIVTIFQTHRGGLALTGLYFYHNGTLEYETRTWTLSPHFEYSPHIPQVKIEGKTLINGYLDEAGKITYILNFEKNGYGIHLNFQNETRGWQGKMGRGWWLAIPKLQVEGILTMGGKQVHVRGQGYHDHNIFDPRSPLHERGYSDGKFQNQDLSLVWGKILHSPYDTDTLAILSKNGSFISIPQETLRISETSHVYDHGHRIPTEISIIINQGEEITVSLIMTAEDFHHIRLPFLKYWRYHVHVTGRIMLKGKENNIDTMGMMELMLH